MSSVLAALIACATASSEESRALAAPLLLQTYTITCFTLTANNMRKSAPSCKFASCLPRAKSSGMLSRLGCPRSCACTWPVPLFNSKRMRLTACCSFQLYHDALPTAPGNFLFHWSEEECGILNALKWFAPAQQSAAHARRQCFDQGLAPIFAEADRDFGSVDFDDFMRLYTLVSSRAFSDCEDSSSSNLIPVFDLINGISCDLATCRLALHCHPAGATGQLLPLRVIETIQDVRCGQEILLEYAELPSHLFLLNYDFLPLHPAYVLSNPMNETLLASAAFLDLVTQWRHPSNAALRQRLKAHVLQHLKWSVPFATLQLEPPEEAFENLRQVQQLYEFRLSSCI